jgi:general secretion pathway protein F
MLKYVGMITFEYKGYDASGRAATGLIEALDPKQAREKLVAAGVLTEWIRPAGAGSGRRWFRRARFPLERRIVFYQELAALLNAGFTLVQALEMLIQSVDMGPVRPLLAGVRDKMREGSSLAEALSGIGVAQHEKALVAAGERAGALGQVLERLAEFMAEQQRLREKVLTALIYPAILLVVAGLVAVGLLGFAMPRFGQLLLEQTRLTIPLLTRILIGAGQIVAVWGLPVLALAGALLLLARQRLRRDPALARATDRRCFRLPVIGRGYVLLVSLRFARALALLLRGGVSLVDGITLAGAATGSVWVGALAEQEAEAVRHGASLAEALRRIPPLADALAGWVQVGEAGGSLDRMLENAGQRLQQQWERYLARRLALLEPALILIIGGFILLVVLAIILPIVSINASLRLR